MSDKDFLIWLHSRLVNVHKENPSVDYMCRLSSIVRAIDGNQCSPLTQEKPVKLLNQQEAETILAEAVRLQFTHRTAKYRLGQAIYNLLPEDIRAEINGTSRDFSYKSDTNEVVDMFYRYCVEKEW